MNKNYFSVIGYLTKTSKAIEAIADNVPKLKRLANRHLAIQVMDCNGCGVIRGQAYYNGTIDDYARRTYGQNVKTCYISDNKTLWDVETEKIEKQINIICGCLGLSVKYQGDPRGATVKLFLKDRDISEIIY